MPNASRTPSPRRWRWSSHELRSEANDLALRIARAHLGRQETLAFEGGYHGNLTSLIDISPYKLDGRGGRPGPPWLHRLPMPDGYRGRFRDGEPHFPASLIATPSPAFKGRGRRPWSGRPS